MKSEELVNYIRDVLQYSLFSETEQNDEYDILLNDGGIVFRPIYPVTFEINEKLYNKIYNILSVALTPQYTLIRPLTMQIIELDGNDIARSRGLYFPIRVGKAKRLVGKFDDLYNFYQRTGCIPLMDGYDWDYVKSPHAIIVGVTNSGKTYLAKTLYRICSKIGDVMAIDPKASDLARLAKKYDDSRVVTPQFITNGDSHGITGQFIQTVISKLKEIEQIVYKRQRAIYQNGVKVSTDYRELGFKPKFVFVDEVAALLTNTNRKIREDFQSVLTRLILLGRESGVYLVLVMQSARAEFIPTIVRDSLSLRIQLGRINSENTKFLFPELSEMPMIPLGGKGTGIVSIAGDDRYAGIEPIATPTITDD